jgi:hypothetical protein
VFSTMYVYVRVYVLDWCVRCPSPAHWDLVYRLGLIAVVHCWSVPGTG